MELYNWEQARIFSYMILSGLAIGAVFDIFRVSRKIFTQTTAVIFICDLIFFLIAAVGVFYFTLLANDGELRWYEFMGTAVGGIIYFLLLSKIFMKILMAIVRLIAIIIRSLYKIITPPIIFLYKPLKIAGRKNKEFARKMKRFTALKTEKAAKSIKLIKKITKKSKKF